MSRFLLWQGLITILLFSCNRRQEMPTHLNASFLQTESVWVDSMLLEMTLDEKIGQLLLFKPDATTVNLEDSLFYYVEKKYLGGVLLKGLDFFTYTEWINALQQKSLIPLFNASEEQASMLNHFIGLPAFPLPATIGAHASDSLMAALATKLAIQNKQLAINLSFALNNDRNDAMQNSFDFKVFKNDPTANRNHTTQLLGELKKAGALAVAGNFKDFHYIENDTTCEIDNLLFDYHHLVEKGLSGIYIDPAIFDIDTLPSLSKHFLKWYLKRNMNFDGLMIADWTEAAPFEELLHAGVDVLIVKDSLEMRLNYIKKYVEEGLFSKKDLNNKVRKVLLAKEWIGLDATKHLVNQTEALQTVTEEADDFQIRKMYESSLTLLQNPKDFLPFGATYKRDFRIVNVGQIQLKIFKNDFSKFAKNFDYLSQPEKSGKINPLEFKKFRHSKLIVTLDGINLDAARDSGFIQSVNDLAMRTQVVLVNFGNPLNFKHFNTKIAMLQSYERNETTESLAAQLLFGALQAKGKLPLVVSNHLPYYSGVDSTAIIRFKYTIPEEVGIAAYKLVGIDAIARTAIGTGATPGCQVLVAKEGKIIYSKSFGTQTYEDRQAVEPTDLYDIASITKVASTTLAAMKLYEEEELQLDGKIMDYLNCGEASPIRNLTLDQLLTHRSGLQSNMPVAPFIMHKDTTETLCNEYFCRQKYLTYIVPVADSFYMDFRWQDTMWQKIYEMKPYRYKKYRYSDVNFNLLQKIVETQSKISIDEFVKHHFYYPLNLERITYNPLETFNETEIVPTALDQSWRKQLLRGYVHDESAALLGGVAGNAGLFANAEDLAVLFQMLLNGGTYGGKTFFKPETVRRFTSRQSGSHRGLGFDLQTRSGSANCSDKASVGTFGHTGFTGTCVWVDPKTELIYIFLSNRINPNVKNRLLFREGTRTRIQSLVYDALGTYPEDKNSKRDADMMRAQVEQ